MKDKFIEAYKMLTSHEGTLFVYAFAYALVVGIAPFLIVTVLVMSNLLLDMDTMVEMMSHYIPSDLILPFITYIK
ncbi:MAG TPA: hypothetical protein VFC75_03975, partial [Erysipelothrix sp.]|nr:hypothetical protein [Erysipelothrix sp.]